MKLQSDNTLRKSSPLNIMSLNFSVSSDRVNTDLRRQSWGTGKDLNALPLNDFKVKQISIYDDSHGLHNTIASDKLELV